MQLSTNQDNLLFDALLKARNEDFHSQPLEEVRCLPLRAQDASLRTQSTYVLRVHTQSFKTKNNEKWY